MFTRRILDAVSELERSLIAARTRAALAQKRKRGERVGSIPLGRQLDTDGKRLLPFDAEQRVLDVLFELRDDGHTLRAIASELNARGYTTRRGGRWHHTYVWLQLRRRMADDERGDEG